jgi:hypothetical protein
MFRADQGVPEVNFPIANRAGCFSRLAERRTNSSSSQDPGHLAQRNSLQKEQFHSPVLRHPPCTGHSAAFAQARTRSLPRGFLSAWRHPCGSPKPQPTEKSITQLLGSHQLFWYDSLPCFDSSDFSLERSFASFARTEVSSSKIWLYVNNSPF